MVTRRGVVTGALGLGAAGVLGAAALPAAVPGDPVEAALDRAQAAIEEARAAYRAGTTVPPTNTPVPPTSTNVPPQPTSAPQTGGIRLVIPSYWEDNEGAIAALVAAGVPSGSVLCGGTGIRNSDGWAGGVENATREQSQVDRYTRAHAAGLVCLTYVGLGELGGGYPASSPGKWNDLGVVMNKIRKNFQLYPESDGIFLDEFPWSGYPNELRQIRDLIRSYPGKLIVGNAAGWQGHDAERDNVTYVDILNVFESSCKTGVGTGGGPYFNNADGSDGFAQPDWYIGGTPASKTCAFVHSVPNTQADIDRAFAVCTANKVGNLYLTDRTWGQVEYVWGAPPSASFMTKFFAKLRAA